MKIQSLSIVIAGGCANSCKFCVSKVTKDKVNFENLMKPENKQDYIDRLEYAQVLGANTVIITGNGEPVMNQKNLQYFFDRNSEMKNPFINIEIQTSGIMLDDNMLKYLKENGVKTISLSLSNIFSSGINGEINQTPVKYFVDIELLCEKIKALFNLRLSLNMSIVYTKGYKSSSFSMKYGVNKIFNEARRLGADQLTFRKLYKSSDDNPVNKWIEENDVSHELWEVLKNYIYENGNALERLPFGALKYSVDGISTVVDDDCMSKKNAEAVKFLILQTNAKLYTRWDDKGSLIM